VPSPAYVALGIGEVRTGWKLRNSIQRPFVSNILTRHHAVRPTEFLALYKK
jgi:hypothetical protein